jgi:hypothetical protein
MKRWSLYHNCLEVRTCSYIVVSVCYMVTISVARNIDRTCPFYFVMHCLLCVKSNVEEMFSLTKPFRLCIDICQEWGVAPIHHQSGVV